MLQSSDNDVTLICCDRCATVWIDNFEGISNKLIKSLEDDLKKIAGSFACRGEVIMLEVTQVAEVCY